MKNQFLENKTKEALVRVARGVREKREAALKKLGLEEESYKNRLRDLRQEVFGGVGENKQGRSEKAGKQKIGTEEGGGSKKGGTEGFEANLTQAKQNLEANGFRVHEAADGAVARTILEDLLRDAGPVVKSKSNTFEELDWEQVRSEGDLVDLEISETDLGDFIVQLFQEEDQHYVLPAIHLSSEQIAAKIQEVYDEEVAADPEALTRFLCDKIREKILTAQTGITGANFITTSGQVVLLENEGNISLISRLPERHIVVCGIDKLVSSVEAATELSRAAALFGTGQESTQYVSVISGPSKTADIENHLALGAQGTREVHIILLDNGRRELLKEGLSEVLRCIGCGNCLNVCPVYQQKGRNYRGWDYIGSRGIVVEEFSRASEELKKTPRGGSLFDCTLCGRCFANCPMKIDLPGLVRKVRQRAEAAGQQSAANQEMLEKVKKTGNPFGGERRETSGELFCC